MYHDIQAWQRFTVTEARRIKKFLNLPDRPGLPGLKAALSLRFIGQPVPLRVLRKGNTPSPCATWTAGCRPPAWTRACPCTPASLRGRRSTAALPAPSTTASAAGASAAVPMSPTRPAPAPGASPWRNNPSPRPARGLFFSAPPGTGRHNPKGLSHRIALYLPNIARSVMDMREKIPPLPGGPAGPVGHRDHGCRRPRPRPGELSPGDGLRPPRQTTWTPWSGLSRTAAPTPCRWGPSPNSSGI